MYKHMHVVPDEDFNAEERRRKDWRLAHWDEATRKSREETARQRDEKRRQYTARFPYKVIVAGGYHEVDNATRWAWNAFGPRDGRCEWEHTSEYPACPLVLATEYEEKGSYPDKAGKPVHWTEKAYREVPAHDHQGKWAEIWLGKTGYDYGNAEFYFENETDRDAFVKAVPTIGLGEKYE